MSSDSETAFYFAFGSNMSSARLQGRISSARSVGRGQLEGYRFAVNKRGFDGSAKANLVRADGERVWGVVYQFERVELSRLDDFEGGYQRVKMTVRMESRVVCCETYLSDRLTEEGKACFDWYRSHMVDGALEHGLPLGWVRMLRSLPARQV